MSDIRFICPNCKKESTKIIHKIKAIPTILVDFEDDTFVFLELSETEHLELRCPECRVKILPPLEDELLKEIKKSLKKLSKNRVSKQESIPFLKPKN